VDEARLRRELAAVYRLIAHYRMADLIYNHISVRLPGQSTGSCSIPSGCCTRRFTAPSMRRARRRCAVLHTHTKAGCAVAAQEHGLLSLNQMSLEFYGRVAYHDYIGSDLVWQAVLRLVDRLYPDYAD
jgi:ribulose-5-phosphate 4-epimerase/fuculose-1-phosphate aldolase